MLADSVFYWELISNRKKNITFQMTSNDVDFFSFQFISTKLARVTYLTYNRKHFCTSHARGPQQPTGDQK